MSNIAVLFRFVEAEDDPTVLIIDHTALAAGVHGTGGIALATAMSIAMLDAEKEAPIHASAFMLGEESDGEWFTKPSAATIPGVIQTKPVLVSNTVLIWVTG